MKYNWQQKDWPEFTFNLDGVEDELFVFSEKAGNVSGMLHVLSESAETQALIDVMLSEAMKTSAIEGEFLTRSDVRSSLRNRLGLNKPMERVTDRRADGAAQLMILVRTQWKEPLSEKMILQWHKALMVAGKQTLAGHWRTHPEPMQVVSGVMGKEKVHFEAPPSDRVPEEMKRFVEWFNNTGPGGNAEIKKAPVRAAVAHLYFESIHPFEDGNGRIGRAIAEKAIAGTLGRPVLLSLSSAIEADKETYCREIEKGQRSNEITRWVEYFVHTAVQAQNHTEAIIDFTLRRTRFFDRYTQVLNLRQLKVINQMLDEGPEGFEGGMNAKKYMALTKASKATATRDIQELAARGVFRVFGAGRSTRYQLVLD